MGLSKAIRRQLAGQCVASHRKVRGMAQPSAASISPATSSSCRMFCAESMAAIPDLAAIPDVDGIPALQALSA